MYNGKHPAQLASELDVFLPQVAARSRAISLSVDVDIGGARCGRAFRGSTPVVERDSRPIFHSGCLLDVFLAIACLEQRAQSGLNLDQPFEEILPELAGLADAEPVTVRQLLTRTSGLQDPRTIREMRGEQPLSWEELSPRIRDAQRLFSPGAVFNYGGVDRIIMAVLLERFSGIPIGRLLRKITIDRAKLELREVQYGPPEADGFRPHIGFDTSTLLDILSHLAKNGGEGNLFDEDIRIALQLDRLQLSRSLKALPWPHAPVAFTNGLFKYSDGLVGFNGWQQNQSCGVRYDSAGGVSFVVALEGPPQLRDVIVGKIADLLGYDSVQARAAPCTIGGLNGLEVEDVLGAYVGWAEGYRARVSMDGGLIVCELDYRGDKFRRVRARLEEGAWLVVDTLAEASAFEFFRDRRGRVCLAQGFLPYAMAA